MLRDTMLLLILILVDLLQLAMTNDFTMFDCKQMFNTKHPCNKQELLSFRWQSETCDRVRSQSELHAFRTCLGHSGIRIQEICNVCSFFTYPMICGREKSKRLLRCLGDQFMIQGHGEEVVVAARLCGNMIRSHHTSTTTTMPLIRPADSANQMTTPPTITEEQILTPYQPPPLKTNQNKANAVQPRAGSMFSGGFPKTQQFRSASKNMVKDDRYITKDVQVNQHRLKPGEKPVIRKAEEGVQADVENDKDDVSVEADAQEKLAVPTPPPGATPKEISIRQTVQNVPANLPGQKESVLGPRRDIQDPRIQIANPIPPPALQQQQSSATRNKQLEFLSQNKLAIN